MAKRIEIDDRKKKEIANYLTTIYNLESANRNDLDSNIDEYWSRYTTQYSAKKDKNFPFVGSCDFKGGIIEYSVSGVVGKFKNAVNSIKFASIISQTSKESAASAKNVENFINNFWYRKAGAKKVILALFQMLVVEGTAFIKVIPKRQVKKVKRFKFREMISNVVNKVRQYLPGQDGQIQTEDKERDEFLGAIWENVPTTKVMFDSSASSLEKSTFQMTEFDLSLSQINNKIKNDGWYNTEKIFKGVQANPQPTIKTTTNTDKGQSEQTKNDYQGFNNLLTTKKTFLEFWVEYNMGTVDEPDWQEMQFIQSYDTKELVWHDENRFFDKRRTLLSCPCWEVSGKIVGEGIPQRLASLSDEFDRLFNQATDNNTLSNTITGTIVEQPGMDIEKMTMQPGQFIPVKAHDNIKQFQFTNRLGDIQVLMQNLMILIERKSLVNDYSMGRGDSTNKKQTARGTQMLLQQQALALDALMQNVQELLRDAIYMTLQDLYEFMPNEGIKYSYQDEATQTYKEGVLMRSDLEYIDDFDIGVLQGVVDVMVNAEKQAAQLLLQAFGQDQTGETNTYEIKKNFATVFAPRKAHDIMREPKEIQQLKMIQAKGQELMQKEQMINQQAAQLDQVMKQHQAHMIGEKAQFEEDKFMYELGKKGVPPQEAQVLLVQFRKAHIAREHAKMAGMNPDLADGVPTPQEQPVAQGSQQ
jgi:hypothetical protein